MLAGNYGSSDPRSLDRIGKGRTGQRRDRLRRLEVLGVAQKGVGDADMGSGGWWSAEPGVGTDSMVADQTSPRNRSVQAISGARA